MKKTAVLAGVLLGIVVLAEGCKPQTTLPDQRIQHAKGIVVDLRKTFEDGRLFDGDPKQDARMLLVIGILKKVHYSTINKEKNEGRKKAILAELDEAMRTFEQVAPKWQQAVNGRKNGVAKDLIPHMQKMETQLDRVTAILQGNTP